MESSKSIGRRALAALTDESRILQILQNFQLPTRSLVNRAAGTSTSSTPTMTCVASEQSNTCEKPAQMTAVLPIALGVTVPIVAIIVFFFLHRRYRKRLQAEDRLDAEKYKSMDFGMDLDAAWTKGGKKGDPEMAKTYQNRQMKGLSMDPGHSPFFLNSDSRAKQSTDSLFEEEDRYKLVKVMDSRSNSRAGTPTQFSRPGRTGTDSTFTTNTQFGSEARLISNAQSPSMSPPARNEFVPMRGDSMSPTSGQKVPKFTSSTEEHGKPLPPIKPEPAVMKSSGLMVPANAVDRDSYFEKNAASIRKSNNYLNDFFTEKPGNKSIKDEHETQETSSASTVVDTRSNSLQTSDSTIIDSTPPMLPPLPSKYDDDARDDFKPYDGTREFESAPTHAMVSKQVPEYEPQEKSQYPPRHKSFEASMHYTPSFVSDHSNLTDILRTPRDSDYDLPPVPALPYIPARGESLAAATPVVEEPEESYHEALDGYLGAQEPVDSHRLSVLMRPLPPDDPMEQPEDRANRIRSFYKEYFDDGKQYTSAMPLPTAPQSQHQSDYYEDYTSEYMNGGATVYDSEQNGFVVASAPYAEPITRRAMTPPPRAPPRFQPQGQQPRGRSRAASNTMTHGGQLMSPRNASAMSNRFPPRGQSAMSHSNRHQGHQKPLAPPKSLKSLPTPHKLKDDAAIFGAADFAPPVSFRELQNGRRPDSPLGGQRPFSPSVRPFVPLNSSFDDLAHVPSPHLLRKSGTFNNLDFAPPPRFKNTDSGSDASSIRSGRSGRSGISAGQHQAMRAGAYRISRVPKELIGTKTDIMTGLKPQWNLTRPG